MSNFKLGDLVIFNNHICEVTSTKHNGGRSLELIPVLFPHIYVVPVHDCDRPLVLPEPLHSQMMEFCESNIEIYQFTLAIMFERMMEERANSNALTFDELMSAIERRSV